MSSADGLPAGWAKKISRSNGQPYYHNERTGQSQWELPTEGQEADSGCKKVRASHILVKHRDSRRPSSWREENITRSKEDAIAILRGYINDINNDKTFEEVAQKYSDCSSAKRQGDLGWFERGQMQKPFEEAAFGLEVDTISPIVETDSGVHIIKRTG